MRGWLTNSRAIILTPLLLALVFILACGGTAATAVPATTQAAAQQQAAATAPAVAAAQATAVPAQQAAPTATVAVVQAQPTSVPAAVASLKGIRGGVVPQLDYADVRQRTLMASSINNKNVAMVFNGLVEYNPETVNPTEIRCDLCTSWDLAEDGMTYTFRLQENAFFSDGHQVTSEDIDYTFLASTCPECIPIRDGETVSSTIAIGAYFDSSRVIDDFTIEVKTLFPTPAFLLSLGSETWRVLPKHVEDGGQLQTTVNMEDLVGSGPYIHVKQVKAVSNHYERNPNYFKEGLPYLDGLDQFIIIDAGTGVAAFKAGQVLMSNGADNFSDAEVVQLAKEEPDKLDLQWSVPKSVQYIFFNTQAAPFDDVRVRRAVNLVLHRQPINETFTGGQGIASSAYFPPGLGFTYTKEENDNLPGTRELNGEKHPDDIAEAKALLADAGIPVEGFKIELATRNCCAYPDISVLVMEQLTRFLDWDVTLKVWEASAGFNAYLAHDYTFAVQRGGANYLDPDAFLDRFREGRLFFRWTGYVIPQIPVLFDAQAKELDVDKRKVLLLEIEDVITADPNAAYLYWRVDHLLINKQIQNFFFKEHVRKYDTIWCDPRC